MKGMEKDEKDAEYMSTPGRGDFVEIDPSASSGLPAVRIDGPYGAPAEDVFNVEVAVLVGAGIGELPVNMLHNATVYDLCYHRDHSET